jgi:hypothetical protein
MPEPENKSSNSAFCTWSNFFAALDLITREAMANPSNITSAMIKLSISEILN